MKDIKEKAEYCLHCKVKPCSKGCPLGNDIPEFIAEVKQENYQKAYEILCRTTVLSPICGRICPHKSQCEGSCVRGIKGESVSIGELEAFVGDMAIQNHYPIPMLETTKKKETIAVIGGGPAGLSCAGYLARCGYSVTIFEKYASLGGILEHGIPEFRLSKEVLEKTIQKILELPITVKYQKELGKNLSVSELEKFDAVFFALGSNISSNMQITGEEKVGVYGGNELLEKKEHPDYTGKRVCVIGGGNVAMDVSRTIQKMGAKEVTVIYRRSKKQIPAEAKEVEDAEKEGVTFLYQTNVLRILGDDKVEKIECVPTQLIQQEGETRETPVNKIGEEYFLPVDIVVMAVGAKPEAEVVNTLGLEITSKGYIKVNENYQTSKEKFFAGGDIIGGKQTVAWAARGGREAGKAIHSYLNEKREG